MNKHDLVVESAKRCELNQSEAKALMEATFNTLASMLAQEDSLTIQNFGTFSVKFKKSHRFYNPFASVMMMAPKKLAVAFHPSKNYNERLDARLTK